MKDKTKSLDDYITIKKRDRESGMVYLRDGITVAFFIPTPLHEVVEPIRAVFDEFLKMIPTDALRWESIGAGSEEWRPVTRTTYDRCRAQLKREAALRRSLTSFELTDGDQGGEAPSHGIVVIGNPTDPELPEERNLLQMYFPSETIAAGNVNDFVRKICSMAAKLSCAYGYASPGLQWAELFRELAMKQARPIAMRHFGLDMQDNVNGRADIDSNVRGARWITFLGPELLARIGGPKVLHSRFSRSITVEDIGRSIMIRAGEQPELGDTTHKIGTPMLREIAGVLEPITIFNEPALLGIEFGDPEGSFLMRWERRFLD